MSEKDFIFRRSSYDRIVSLDFDGTIVQGLAWNEVESKMREHPPADGLKEFLILLKATNSAIVLNTCREDDNLGVALYYLYYWDLLKYFTTFNCNLFTGAFKDCRKVFADWYIDDKSFFGVPDFRYYYRIYEQALVQKGKPIPYDAIDGELDGFDTLNGMMGAKGVNLRLSNKSITFEVEDELETILFEQWQDAWMEESRENAFQKFSEILNEDNFGGLYDEEIINSDDDKFEEDIKEITRLCCGYDKEE